MFAKMKDLSRVIQGSHDVQPALGKTESTRKIPYLPLVVSV